MDDEQPRGRLSRLFEAADRRNVPLRTILVTVGVVAATYLTGQLVYRLREIVLLMLVAGFTAMLLNPAVAQVQRRVPRRGLAVTIITLGAALAFIGLAAVFGVPLVNGITHLADRLPGYVASAQHGRGWIGHLVARYHVQSWVQRNTPKLAGYAQSLGKPALTVGKGAVSLIVELLTLFILVLLLLLEGPKMWNWTLGQMTPARGATVTRIAADVSGKVTGYMAGNLLTSLIAGVVVFVTLLVLGVPFPLLWGLWVALVDFLPMIGGALAGIPTVLFAFIAGGPTAGIVTAVVFAVYTQIENHVLNPVIMSKTVRVNPLLIFIAVLVGASLGNLIGGLFGGLVAALLAIPTAGALQVLAREVWHATAPDQAGKSPPPSGEPAPRPLAGQDLGPYPRERGKASVTMVHRVIGPGDAMAENEQLVIYAAAYGTAEAALADLDAVEQLHKTKIIGWYDAAVIDKENGKPHVVKRMDRPHIRVIPEWFGGGTLPRMELHEAAEQLTANQAGLVAVGEPTIEEALDQALTKAARVVKRTVEATADEITSELQEALKS